MTESKAPGRSCDVPSSCCRSCWGRRARPTPTTSRPRPGLPFRTLLRLPRRGYEEGRPRSRPRSRGSRTTIRTFERWVGVFDKVDRQKMPPPSRKRPDPDARARFLEGSHRAAGREPARQRPKGALSCAGSSRRVREHAPRPAGDRRPVGSIFSPRTPRRTASITSPLGLRLSMLQLEQYLEAADAAISAAMEFRRRPQVVHKRLRYHDEESVRDDLKKPEKQTFRVLPDAVVIFDDNSPTVLRQWIVPGSRTIPDPHSGRAYQAAGRPAGRSCTPRTSRPSNCSPTSTCRPTGLA